MSVSLRFAPGVADLASLGDGSAEAWLAAAPDQLDPRAELVGEREGSQHLRLPLPGTPHADGDRSEAPRGAGTGWLHLHRYSGAGLSSLVSRLTTPRSSSLAARHWNLICHLRAHGVGAPELVALGEAARGPWTSFVITRELEGFTPASALIETGLAERERRLALRSVGLALRGLYRCGAWLPHLGLENVWIQTDAARGPDACGVIELESLQRDARTLRALGLRRTRLPAVAFTEFRRARVLDGVRPARRVRQLEALAAELPPSVGRGERLAVRVLATR